MVVFFAVCGECADSIAFMFSREVSLRGVGNVTMGSSFNDKAATYFDDAIKRKDVKVDSFTVPPDVVIVVRAWLQGSQEEVEKSTQALNATFNGWSTAPDGTLVSNLNKLSLENLETQPSDISFKDSCGYAEEKMDVGAAGFGFDNLTLVLTMRTDPGESLTQHLCLIFSMPDCALIALDAVRNSVDGYVAHVTVISSNRNLLFIELMNHVRHASLLFPEYITTMTVGGVQVYVQEKPPTLTYKGNTSSCSSRYWYLIFGVLLMPLALIAGQRFKDLGAESGVKSVRAMEWDIRSGVRYQGRIHADMDSRGLASRAAISGSSSPGAYYGVYDPQEAMWQHTQGRRRMPQPGLNVHYDPNAH
ncbi:hypothetical protein TraAM80_00337 [Trypanosoma rangeli]|uniref:Uncharacterized protein n=1 Tax=Trypanosoma rangeli TaxID=5698 RepID=A0A3R7P473_TRYRA|nr:uncharacterized protein TraAM80_00337 [Trypanosoma rangeli]RNF12484.1 hypothetical protein TraAM80_00337 [Trypanosoma rangeli]|eukprot:RNF12484.1 hypothetical protein TraAM80_00337 [Trypanosoma rangeli]